MSETVRDLLGDAVSRLRHLDTANLDAEVLLAFTLQISRGDLFAHPEKPVPPGAAADFYSLISKRSRHFPIAYLTGIREFWSLALSVSQDTLIPRPETEVLVEAALSMIPRDAPFNILDLGTGTGAVAIAISSERPHCRITASDISPEALSMARNNAIRHGMGNIEFRKSDWFSDFSGKVFDMIVCNPPYIDTRDRCFQSGDLYYEPRVALDGGYLGMNTINHIIPSAPEYLKPGGGLILEHGFDQGESVRYLFSANSYTGITTRLDYSGHERITIARNRR